MRKDIVLSDFLPPSATGMSAHELESIGILAIGVLDGPLNEHATDKSARKGVSCAEMTAKYLGVLGDRTVRRLVDLVNATESGAWRAAAKKLPKPVSAVTDFTISALVRRMSGEGMEHMALVRFFDPVFEMEADSQAKFERAEREVCAVGQFVELRGGPIKGTIYVAETGLPQVHLAAFRKSAKVAVIRNPETGQVFATVSGKSGLALGQAAAALRVAEAEKRGEQPLALADAFGEQLKAPHGAWYYQGGGAERVFNGRNGQPPSDPTRLDLETIAQIIGGNLVLAPKAAG